MHFSYECSTSSIKRITSIKGKKHVEIDYGRQRGCPCAAGLWERLPSTPQPRPWSHLRVSQEEVGPDLIDVAQRGGPPDPQQALQRGQRRRLVGGHWGCSVDFGPPEILLLQGVHPGIGWTSQWLEARSLKGSPADLRPEWCRARWHGDDAGRASASSHEVANQLSRG